MNDENINAQQNAPSDSTEQPKANVDGQTDIPEAELENLSTENLKKYRASLTQKSQELAKQRKELEQWKVEQQKFAQNLETAFTDPSTMRKYVEEYHRNAQREFDESQWSSAFGGGGQHEQAAEYGEQNGGQQANPLDEHVKPIQQKLDQMERIFNQMLAEKEMETIGQTVTRVAQSKYGKVPNGLIDKVKRDVASFTYGDDYEKAAEQALEQYFTLGNEIASMRASQAQESVQEAQGQPTQTFRGNVPGEEMPDLVSDRNARIELGKKVLQQGAFGQS